MELGIDVDGHVLVELEFLVVDVGHEVEGRVDNLEFDKIFIFSFIHVRLRNVDDDAKSQLFVSLVFVFSGVSLSQGRSLPE